MSPNPRRDHPSATEQSEMQNAALERHADSKDLLNLVANQAAANPAAPALVAGDLTMTYGELDRRSNQLAHHLIALGAGPECIVAICLRRSPEAVACALAVLKTGGAFLPLDPTYPAERLGLMLSDAQPQVLITSQNLSGQVPVTVPEIVYLENDAAEIDHRPAEAPRISPAPENLAYVIYTSGSTGQPKGVEITHKSLLNLLLWHNREFGVTSSDRASHLAGVGFDAAIWEVWPYLAAGASLHLPDEATRVSPEQLRDWLVAERITISFLPTALAERVMSLEWPGHAALRFLLTGADTLHRYPTVGLPFELVNNYGPTECTVVATSGRVPPGLRSDGRPTIGRPIADTQIYILDEALRQVAPGMAGELYIGGVGVARGYRNLPELTAERFIRDPFSSDPGARLYKTGDKATYLSDGQIAYLGRIDEQIKMLGYRIEPNEIIAALDRHPAIESSVVVARGGAASDEKRLVAYVTFRRGDRPAAAELADFIRKDLPDYMVPHLFAQLEALPLTVNGKVDRAALPDPSAENTLRDEAFIAPRTPIEERLVAVLTTLLHLDEVSVNDNFFMLGGHSLLGTQLIATLRSAFSVDLSLRTLFDSPTIAELAGEIERMMPGKVDQTTAAEVRKLPA